MVALALGTGVALAQVTDQMSGVAKDSTGAAVPGVEVTVTQTETGFTKSTMTNESGNYLLTQLPLGPYRLEAKKAGFQTYAQTGIVLQVGTNPVIPLSLSVGAVAESVEVQANVNQVETQNMGVGSVVENQRVIDLPLNGRQPTDLITLAGAAVQTGTSPSYAVKTGVMISVAGGQTYGVEYLLDGAQHSNFYDASGFPLPFPDALQEFKVDTSALTANNGIHSGASVSAVTKSGTNNFHGDAFEFIRNQDVNARNAFSPTVSQYKRNQTGGTFGGPIKKEKIFFFLGYQGTFIRQQSPATQAFVPTLDEIQGNFSQFMNNAACGTAGKNLVGFPGNIIPTSQLSPAAITIASKLVGSSTDPVCGKTTYTENDAENNSQWVSRLDYSINEKQTLFWRYIGTKWLNGTPYNTSGGNLLTVNPITAAPTINNFSQDDLATSITLGHTYVINANTVNSIRASLNRASGDHGGPHYFDPAQVGINAYATLPYEMVASASGLWSLNPGPGAYLFIDPTQLQLNDDVSWVHGAHQFGFGILGAQSAVVSQAHVQSQGTYTASGIVSGNAMADWMLGDVAFRQQTPNAINEYERYLGIYAQDTWKARHNLTLNYGLRWEPFFPNNFKLGNIYNFSLANYEAGIRSVSIPGAPPGLTFPGDPGFNGKASMAVLWKEFEPRFGFAWDPKGDGKTSIRAGAGISYDFINQQIHHNTGGASPFGGVLNLSLASLDNPYAGYGTPFPYTYNPQNPIFGIAGGFYPIPYNLNTPGVYNWNLSVQRQLTKEWFGSINYMGNHAIHLVYSQEDNPPTFMGLGPCTLNTVTGPVNYPVCSTAANEFQRRLLYQLNPTTGQYFGQVDPYTSAGTSHYEGLMFNSTYRLTRGLNVNANYTWSHCIGTPTTGNSVMNVGTVYLNPNNRYYDEGNCSQDRRQLANLTVVAQTPKFDNKALHMIVTGWTLSGIYTFRTGDALNITTSDVGLTGNSSQRPNIVSGANPYAGTACGVNCVGYFNLAAFSQPTAGSLGNVGNYGFYGPAYWDLDMALSRDFRVWEGKSITFRAEGFNITNSVRLQDPATVFSTSTTFGTIRASYDPRILQAAVKFTF
jgi:hypothetical protein